MTGILGTSGVHRPPGPTPEAQILGCLAFSGVSLASQQWASTCCPFSNASDRLSRPHFPSPPRSPTQRAAAVGLFVTLGEVWVLGQGLTCVLVREGETDEAPNSWSMQSLSSFSCLSV